MKGSLVVIAVLFLGGCSTPTARIYGDRIEADSGVCATFKKVETTINLSFKTLPIVCVATRTETSATIDTEATNWWTGARKAIGGSFAKLGALVTAIIVF